MDTSQAFSTQRFPSVRELARCSHPVRESVGIFFFRVLRTLFGINSDVTHNTGSGEKPDSTAFEQYLARVVNRCPTRSSETRVDEVILLAFFCHSDVTCAVQRTNAVESHVEQ